MPTAHEELSTLQLAELDAGLVFSGKATGNPIQGFARPCAYTPKRDDGYIFHPSSRDVAVWFLNAHDPLYIYGPTGCGKTSLVKQLAARLQYPVFEVTCHGRMEYADLCGHLSVQQHNMVYEYGPLALAMKFGCLLLLNEADLLSPEVLAGLNSVLEGSPLCLAENGGELITPHPMFRLCATANTNGGGDATGLYQGALQQNIAVLDRFQMCAVDYPEPATETALLAQRYPQLPQSVVENMVKTATEVRKLFMGTADSLSNAIEVTFSTRTLLRWAALTVQYQPLASQGIQPIGYALDRALGFRATRSTRAMLHELVQRVFPPATL